MSDGTQQKAWGPAALGLTLLGALAATSAVVLWTLASPSDDPVGALFETLGDSWDGLERWYVDGPVDAQPNWAAMQQRVVNGDASRGRVVMSEYGCGSCHVIPGVAGAVGTVGPSLSGFSDRAYIAGILTNAPGDLTRWLINPPLFAPETAMPDMGVSERDAADMAAYLYTLGRGR